MGSEVKKPIILEGLGIPELPAKIGEFEIVGAVEDSRVLPPLDVFEEMAFGLEERHAQHVQQNLGALRKQIVDDPEGEGVQKNVEEYFTAVEAATLPEVIAVEARLWEKYMKSENPALERVAFRTYYRLVQHESYTMSISEAYRGSEDLLARIEYGDLHEGMEALDIYQEFVETFFSCRRDLINMEASSFRNMARSKIHRALAGDVDENMILHLEDLLAAYARITGYDGIDEVELGDGSRWIAAYTQQGHPLECCAREVLQSLGAARESLNQDLDHYLVKGEIDTEKNAIKTGKVPAAGALKVIVEGALTTIGSKNK